MNTHNHQLTNIRSSEEKVFIRFDDSAKVHYLDFNQGKLRDIYHYEQVEISILSLCFSMLKKDRTYLRTSLSEELSRVKVIESLNQDFSIWEQSFWKQEVNSFIQNNKTGFQFKSIAQFQFSLVENWELKVKFKGSEIEYKLAMINLLSVSWAIRVIQSYRDEVSLGVKITSNEITDLKRIKQPINGLTRGSIPYTSSFNSLDIPESFVVKQAHIKNITFDSSLSLDDEVELIIKISFPFFEEEVFELSPIIATVSEVEFEAKSYYKFTTQGIQEIDLGMIKCKLESDETIISDKDGNVFLLEELTQRTPIDWFVKPQQLQSVRLTNQLYMKQEVTISFIIQVPFTDQPVFIPQVRVTSDTFVPLNQRVYEFVIKQTQSFKLNDVTYHFDAGQKFIVGESDIDIQDSYT